MIDGRRLPGMMSPRTAPLKMLSSPRAMRGPAKELTAAVVQRRGMAAVQQNTSYKREIEAGSVLAIRSSVLEVRDKVLRFSHEMLDAETQHVVATSELTGVHFDRDTRKSCPFPPNIVERAQACSARGDIRVAQPGSTRGIRRTSYRAWMVRTFEDKCSPPFTSGGFRSRGGYRGTPVPQPGPKMRSRSAVICSRGILGAQGARVRFGAGPARAALPGTRAILSSARRRLRPRSRWSKK